MRFEPLQCLGSDSVQLPISINQAINHLSYQPIYGKQIIHNGHAAEDIVHVKTFTCWQQIFDI